jgi:autotransporter-associated beta strand protein
MKKGIRYARLSASIVAVLYGAAAHAQSVTWDPTQSDINPPVDGSGNWDLTTPNWYNSGTATDVQWSNAVPYSAVFGDPSSAAASGTGTENNVTLAEGVSINAQDIVLGTATNGSGNGYYSFFDQDDGNETLTLNGNLIKASAVGESVFQLSSPIVLPAGNHVVAINDTPGAVPELSMEEFNDNSLTGPGSITMNNAYNSSGYAQYGTFVLDTDNTYTGGTNIVDGALTANASNALGTGAVTISNQGALEFGGNGTTQPNNMTITNPVVISRNTYTGTNFSDYPYAIISTTSGAANSGAVTLTFNSPTFEIDSTNAVIESDTSDIVINTNLTNGPDVTAGALTLQGDFAGYVTLNGNNTGLTGGITLTGGVELNVTNYNNLGGPTATLNFNGSATLHPVGGFMTNFGSLNVNYSTFAGGIDVDSGSTFTIGQNLGTSGNTSGSIGMRGAGTMILSGTDSLGGSTYWDGWSAAPNGSTTTGGVVDVTGTVALGSIHLRSPTVNITGTLTANDPGNSGQFDSVGEASNGTNGGPDEAIVNITGNGEFDSTTGDTFYVSDGANTQGTINLSGNGQFITGGVTEVGVNGGATGTINQTGGSLTINRNGNFGLVLGDGRNANGGNGPVGTYNLSVGTFSDENGEIYVGEGNNGGPGIGYWTQTGGTATFGNWFVVGREGAKGTVLISGGSLTKDASNGGANVSIGEGGANVCTLTVDNTGSFTIDSGQFYDGNNSSVGIVNVGSLTDPVGSTPSLSVANNWFAVGRNGTSNGTLNLYDGSITITNVTTGPAGNQNYFDISGDGGSPTGVVNVYGGTLSAQQTLIGENGSGTATVNIYGGTVSLGTAIFANSGSVSGTINLNGGTLIGTGFTAQNGVLNESGGTGPGYLYFNGGTLSTTPGNVNNNFVGAKVTSIVSAGGAIINANGGYININSALTHNSNVTTDGGLTITGTGTVQLGTAGSHTPQNTYNGGTTVNSGTLIIATAGALPSGSNVANSAAFVVGANSTAGNVSGTGKTTVNSGVALAASNFTQGALVDNGSAQINGSGTIGTSNDLGAITGTGTMTIGTGSSANTIHLATNSGQSTLGTLVISSGSALDIGNDSLILHYSSPATDPIASIAAWIKNGFYDLAGPQIISTDIATDDTASGFSYGIGYADGADGAVAGLPSGEIEIAYTLLGDANLDGTVNSEDFTPFSSNLNQSAIFAAEAGPLEVSNGISLTNVPEPASTGLLALGGLCALRRRRRNT